MWQNKRYFLHDSAILCFVFIEAINTEEKEAEKLYFNHLITDGMTVLSDILGSHGFPWHCY